MPSRAFLILPLIVLLGSTAPLVVEVPLAVQIITAHLEARSSAYVLAGTLKAKDSGPTLLGDGGRLVSVAVRTGDHVVPGTGTGQA